MVVPEINPSAFLRSMLPLRYVLHAMPKKRRKRGGRTSMLLSTTHPPLFSSITQLRRKCQCTPIETTILPYIKMKPDHCTGLQIHQCKNFSGWGKKASQSHISVRFCKKKKKVFCSFIISLTIFTHFSFTYAGRAVSFHIWTSVLLLNDLSEK